jgi:predicted RNA-binding Zn-ribbon protein involved in translation (DUF1610 family)
VRRDYGKLPEWAIPICPANRHASGAVYEPRERQVADTIVKTTCGHCGDVELSPAQLELRICTLPERSVYAFTCPTCETEIVKPAADTRVVRLLTSVGVPTVGWGIPKEALERPDGPPLTNDDLLDLHLLLDRNDWFDQLLRAPAHS